MAPEPRELRNFPPPKQKVANLASFISLNPHTNNTTAMLLQPSAIQHNYPFALATVRHCAVCHSTFAHSEYCLSSNDSRSGQDLYACSHYCKLMYEETLLEQSGKAPRLTVNAEKTKKRKIAEINNTATPNDKNQSKNISDAIKINLEYSALILDTNVWISYLSFIQTLKKIKGLQIIVPSIVIQELDQLKVKSDAVLAMKARAAINFMLEELSNSHEWIRGQKIQESNKQVRGWTAENTPALSLWTADDHILDCALYFTPHNAALVTQDKALALKAQINQVGVLDVARLMKRIPVLATGTLVNEPTTGTLVNEPTTGTLVNEPASKRRRLSAVADNKHSFTPARVSPVTRHVSSVVSHGDTLVAVPRDLPVELWHLVCQRLPPSALHRVARVNRSVAAVVREDETWRASVRRLFRDTRDVLVPRGRSARLWYQTWRRNTLTWDSS